MKTLIFSLLCIFLLVSCVSTESTDANVKTTRAMFDAFNRHDWNAMTKFYSDSALFLDPSFGKNYVSKTRQETAKKYAEMEKMFPDIHDELVGVYPSGDYVTIEFVSMGTISDSIKFSLPIITVLTFENDLIVKDATYYDAENP